MERTRLVLRPMEPVEAAACEALMRALPDWFGIEEAIVQYREDLATMSTSVAVLDDAIVGFITLSRFGTKSAEIHVMAVLEDRHRQGVGRALVEDAERTLRLDSVEFLQVKTLGPSRPNDAYARTRAFYRALGFVPLEENMRWGPVNPCLILVKHLSCGRSTEPDTP